jgi:hypothetical protein
MLPFPQLKVIAFRVQMPSLWAKVAGAHFHKHSPETMTSRLGMPE